jgi:hypothetical protein
MLREIPIMNCINIKNVDSYFSKNETYLIELIFCIKSSNLDLKRFEVEYRMAINEMINPKYAQIVNSTLVVNQKFLYEVRPAIQE